MTATIYHADHENSRGEPCEYALKACPMHGYAPKGFDSAILENPNAGGYPEFMRETRNRKGE